MLSLHEIRQNYPESLQGFNRFILREYLQHKILQIIFDSKYAGQLVFLGGTCLRIVHNNSRFSEYLDFDNFNMDESVFENIAKLIEKQLQREGYETEMKTVFKGAYHCHIRFQKLLYNEGLSGFADEKILIQLDTEPQHFSFEPEQYLLNRFDIFTRIFITPLDILLAQKFYAVINRKRNKGRDFFDIVFLLSKISKPNYAYLDLKLGIKNETQLKEMLFQKCSTLNMEEMAKDVEPFLFNTADVKKIVLFTQLIEQSKLI